MPENKRTEIIVEAPLIRSNHRVKAKDSTVSEMRRFFKLVLRSMYRAFFSLVLSFFKTVNRKIGPSPPWLSMECETLEHVDLTVKVFKWIVLPASLLYVCSELYFFRQNTLDSMLLSMLIFVYSSFLPDLPSVYRRKKIYIDLGIAAEDLPWYKKYALLLFAPLFLGAFLAGIRLRWKTTETFHNFRSLVVYEVFLLSLSFLAFGGYPISTGNILEILSTPSFGLIGYLTHLRVDCFF